MRLGVAALTSAGLNTSVQIGAFISPIALSVTLQSRADDWTTPLCIGGGLYLCGAVCWYFVDPLTPIAVGHDGMDEDR